VRITAPLGLSAGDEYYLWGLLALTCWQPNPTVEFVATPHYCLRQLGCIDQHAKRGGRQYQRLSDAIERLSAVTYRNDSFYDPIRGEHRKVGFGFLSYSLPVDPASSRAWRILWDPLFFEFCMAGSRQFRFDLATYRGLDCASRRLFLLLQKMFSARQTDARFELRHLATRVLGFNEALPLKTLRKKCQATLDRLAAAGIIASATSSISGSRGKPYNVLVKRGRYFSRQSAFRQSADLKASPLYEPLAAIGLDESAIRRCIRDFRPQLVQEWADITLAAMERKGKRFFRKSPQAYFVDNIQQATRGNRTPPDWWHQLRRVEHREPERERLRSPTPVAEIVTQVMGSLPKENK
jgi:hypothetical protein